MNTHREKQRGRETEREGNNNIFNRYRENLGSVYWDLGERDDVPDNRVGKFAVSA